MSFLGVERGYSLTESKSTKVTVPNDNHAKLMYYLSCVNSCIDLIKSDSNVIKYDKYYTLSESDKEAVVTLAALCSPDNLDEVVFQVADNSQLLKSFSNQFYNLNEATKIIGGAVSRSGVVLIGGEQKKVTKIMVHNERWLRDNYYDALKGVIADRARATKALCAKGCSYAQTGRSYKAQHYYRCNTCGYGEGLGVCQHCADTCHRGHDLSDKIWSSGFFCDCGADGHVTRHRCTYEIYGKRYMRQPVVRCYTCGLSGNCGVCMYCAEKHHKGHRVSVAEWSNSFFCDCGPRHDNDNDVDQLLKSMLMLKILQGSSRITAYDSDSD